MTEAIQEFVDSRGVSLRVDRQQGVLRGVKLIGLMSRNGRRYRELALQQAKTLYEEAKVNVNHPKEGPLAPRDYQDRMGVIRGVEFREGEGLFGDLHFNPKHPLAEQLAWDADHNPRNVGFSHNVLARLSRDGENAVVEEITRVQSVDLVADPAATLGLYEQTDPTHRWDALTVATLQLHRPDLVEEMRAAATEHLQQELDEAHANTDVLERRHRVVELLCEHGLPVPLDEAKHCDPADVNSRMVSPAFFEMLTKVQDEAQLKQLIAERAELARSAPAWQNRFLPGAPRSRDQVALESRHFEESVSAADFAKSIKSVAV